MLTKSQEKLIKSLNTKKGRKESGMCLVEGKKVIELASKFVDYTFQSKDTKDFKKLVTTEAPQALAAVAKIPKWQKFDITQKDIIVVLDGVQDPGNVGSILRLCFGFNASLVLVESADPANPKVIRSSVGAMFKVPWISVTQNKINGLINEFNRPVYLLEKKPKSKEFKQAKIKKPIILVAGSEGNGIRNIKGESVYLNHNIELESLNVGQALGIALYLLHDKK